MRQKHSALRVLAWKYFGPAALAMATLLLVGTGDSAEKAKNDRATRLLVTVRVTPTTAKLLHFAFPRRFGVGGRPVGCVFYDRIKAPDRSALHDGPLTRAANAALMRRGQHNENRGDRDVAISGTGGALTRMLSLDLAVNAIVAGLLLGGFYAAVTIGVTISFGMLDIVNIAHPAFIMLGSFVAYILNSHFGVDPILTGIVAAPVFLVIGMGVYQIYYYAFERRGEESIQGLAFFFGLLFVGEVALILVFGVDYRFVEAPYIGPSL